MLTSTGDKRGSLQDKGEKGGTQSRQILKPTPEPTLFHLPNDHDDRLAVVVLLLAVATV